MITYISACIVVWPCNGWGNAVAAVVVFVRLVVLQTRNTFRVSTSLCECMLVHITCAQHPDKS
jgi:hypothetical protein